LSGRYRLDRQRRRIIVRSSNLLAPSVAVKWLELRIPPPVVALIFAGLMAVCAQALPMLSVPVPRHGALAFTVALLGLAIDVAAVVSFLRARTTINPTTPDATRSLVISGIYSVTRNPMYVGLTLLLIAFGLYLSNALALGVVTGFVTYLTRYQIRPEERILREKFGHGYDNYARGVRRWI
jgi:protein-S-isoprenylcysteine O-methyltransferase Ste14